MLEQWFSSVLPATVTGDAFPLLPYLLCTLCSLALGAVIAAAHAFRNTTTKGFLTTLALLPAIVQMVIMLVNGNIGAGIAVMGVFNLVRFRSIPGSAKDIGSVFLAMAVGLATGMGFVLLAVLFVAIVAVANVVYVLSPFGRGNAEEKRLRITVPEDFEYENAFDTVLARYTKEHELVSVETSNMGSLYQLEYKVKLEEGAGQKRLLDEIRCHNGNLKVSLGLYSEREVL